MRQKVEHYSGHKITNKVFKKISLIDLKRIQEGVTQFSIERIKNLKQLCKIHDTIKAQEHIILGEDWYISYTKINEDEISINDWVAINNVENKFAQTMEMFNALKKILLENSQAIIYSMLRHSTSYPFYKKLLNEGYIEEGYDIIDFDDCTEELERIKEEILLEYDSFEEYLLDENRDKYEEYFIEDYIYHEVSFNMTESFTNRYTKSGR